MIESVACSLEAYGVRRAVVLNGYAIYVHFGRLPWFFDLLGQFQEHCRTDGDFGLACATREEQFSFWIGDDLAERRHSLAESEEFDVAQKAMLLLDEKEFQAALVQRQ